MPRQFQSPGFLDVLLSRRGLAVQFWAELTLPTKRSFAFLSALDTTLHLASDSLTINGKAYLPALVADGEIERALDRKDESTTLQIENITTVYGARLLKDVRALDGATITLGRWWKETESAQEHAEQLFVGRVEEASGTREALTLTILSDIYSSGSLGGDYPVQARCPLQFNDPVTRAFRPELGIDCGYTGALFTCDKIYESLDGCAGRSNQHRYGGVVHLKGDGAVSGPGGYDKPPRNQIVRDGSVEYPRRTVLQLTGAVSISDDEPNDTTVIDMSGGGGTLDTVGDPVDAKLFDMQDYTLAFAFNATTGTGTNLFTVTNASNDTGTGPLVHILTPGATNAKTPLQIEARGYKALVVAPDGKVGLGPNVLAGTPQHALHVTAGETTTPNRLRAGIFLDPTDQNGTYNSYFRGGGEGAGNYQGFCLAYDASTNAITLYVHDAADQNEANDIPALRFVRATGRAHVITGLAVTTARAFLGGTLKMNTTPIGNVTTGEDDLITYTVPGGVLAATNERLDIYCFGTFAGNANAKRIRAYYAGTGLFDTGAALLFNGGAWELRITIIRTGTTTAIASAKFLANETILEAAPVYTSFGPTHSGDNIFKLTGEATATDDISQKAMIMEWHPTGS